MDFAELPGKIGLKRPQAEAQGPLKKVAAQAGNTDFNMHTMRDPAERFFLSSFLSTCRKCVILTPDHDL